MSFVKRVLVGVGLGALASLVGGPAGAYAGWKFGGFLVTRNILHLVPGGGVAADGMSLVADVAGLGSDLVSTGADVASLGSDVSASFADGIDVQGNDSIRTAWGGIPTDVQGNDPRNTIFGTPPSDVWGRPA